MFDPQKLQETVRWKYELPCHHVDHLAAKDIFEDDCMVVVIIITLCVIVRANTGTCTTCGDNTTTRIACKSFIGRNTAGSVWPIMNHSTISMSKWPDTGCTNVHIDSRARGCGARGCVLRRLEANMCVRIHHPFFYAIWGWILGGACRA